MLLNVRFWSLQEPLIRKFCIVPLQVKNRFGAKFQSSGSGSFHEEHVYLTRRVFSFPVNHDVITQIQVG